MALREDATVEFLDNGPTAATPKLRAHQVVDPAHVRELKRRLLVIGVPKVGLAGAAVQASRRVKKVQREYAWLARQLGVSIHALDSVLGINGGTMHPIRAEMDLPSWEAEFPPRAFAVAWAEVTAQSSVKSSKAVKSTNQLPLPGTEGVDAPRTLVPLPSSTLEALLNDAGPLEVVVRQRGRGEMKFAVRSTAEISKLVKVLEGLL